MDKKIFLYLLLLAKSTLGQFDPPAKQPGSKAIAASDKSIVLWAKSCSVNRGLQDISNSALGYASVGDTLSAVGAADGLNVLSLGDGGSAILTFEIPITNANGYDFAVFENSFDDVFLELAFVEVSSDGINYFRFPPTSNTQTSTQISGFGSIDATKINNLAGKYTALYGTPFDLEELKNTPGLNINRVTHVKIIDVVGCIQNAYATFDKNGNTINDPWKTDFPSGGFDLDAVAVLNVVAEGIENIEEQVFSIYPNPTNNMIYYNDKPFKTGEVTVLSINGEKIIQHSFSGKLELDVSFLPQGIYIIHINSFEQVSVGKFTKL